jgi:hypothetical protein
MKPFTMLVIIASALCSCSAPVLKRAHVIPVYDGQILISAHPEFIGAGGSLYDDASFTRPNIWSYVQFEDGSTLVHWISDADAQERLALMDSGFHPIVVPPQAITMIKSSGQETKQGNPTVLDIPGTNTASIPEAVTLVPYRP